MLDRLFARAPLVVVGLIPAATLISLSTVTVVVWRHQIANQHVQLVRHTEDIAVQSAQRLTDIVEANLRIARVMAGRWAAGERTPQRFDSFARLVTRDLRAFDSVELLTPDLKSAFFVPEEPGLPSAFMGPMGGELAALLVRPEDVAISAAEPIQSGRAGFLALVPVDGEGGRIGYLGVHFRVGDIVGQCFHQQILEEFEITVADGEARLFHSTRQQALPTVYTRLVEALDPAPEVNVQLLVRNRRWRLTMRPLVPEKIATWTSNLAVPRLGFVLSVGLSLAAYLLLSRMRSAQLARDVALAQVAERERVQEALRRSEGRYRDVFASASEGLVVVDPEGIVLEVNPAAAAMAGVAAEAMLGRPLHDFYGDECGARCRDLIAGSTSAISRLEGVVTRADGQRTDFEMRATRLRHDEEARLLVIVSDVTERKRALERHALLSRKVLAAQEEERGRVARELHDELGQLLTAIRLEMGWFKKRIDTDSKVDMDMFHEAVKLVERAADESRRICRGLRPPLLDDLGLEPAVQLLVEEFKERAQVHTSLLLDVEEWVVVPRELALCTYRIVQEALTNVSRHARAKHAEVRVCVTVGHLEVEVVDDGVGFDPGARQGCGIEGMSERSNLVNGSLRIQSSPGAGTRVRFTAGIARAGEELSA